MEKQLDNEYSSKNLFKFILPSLLGVLFFITPIVHNKKITIPIAILSKFVQTLLSNTLPFIMTIIIFITCFASIMTKIFKPNVILRNKFLNTLFNVSPLWFCSRVLGMIFAILTFFKIGPSFIWSENTGGLLLYDLLPILFSVFLFAGMLLPLLLNFGLLEFFG